MKRVPGVYFTYSKTNRHPLQLLLSETEAVVILTKLNNDYFVSIEKNYNSHEETTTIYQRRYLRHRNLISSISIKLANAPSEVLFNQLYSCNL